MSRRAARRVDLSPPRDVFAKSAFKVVLALEAEIVLGPRDIEGMNASKGWPNGGCLVRLEIPYAIFVKADNTDGRREAFFYIGEWRPADHNRIYSKNVVPALTVRGLVD